jgi:hypothetical protein
MRIRTIKPEFYLHEELFELERESKLPIRLAFTGLWCVADREGRFKWEPRKIGVQILPYDMIDFSRVLDALTTRGFIVRYALNEELFGYIPSFTRHQVINNRESQSILPNPCDCNVFDACPTRAPRVPHGNTETERGREGKGREGNKERKGREGKGTVEEFKEFAATLGMPENDGLFFFQDCEEKGWRRGKEPIKDWRLSFQKWKTAGWLPSQKTNSNKPKANPTSGMQEQFEIPEL